MIGTSLGPYKIIEQLGAGGMGEVYLGEDTRLGRKVAIKVLPAEFAGDPERLARFEQEAKAAAALNHPHIAVVHDVGAEGETHFIVQEYLEGHSLRERLDKGALPLDKALDLGVEVGEALIAAHKAGIIHRDLKPDNIFVTEEGHAKVLDFGLAKLTEVASVAGASASMSPTMLGTVAGQVMGTAGYMAPEQVAGDTEIDHRADLFAFGCVLYGMVTGRQAFRGQNVHETLGKILSAEPAAVAEIDASLPAELQRIIRKALAKDVNRRYQTASDLSVDLRQLQDDVAAGTAPGAAFEPAPRAASSGLPTRVVVPVAAALMLLVAATTWFVSRPTPEPGPVVRFDIHLPEGVNLESPAYPTVAISRDGSEIVFNTPDGLWRKGLDETESTNLRGTGDALAPFMSYDGRQVGFWADGELKRISIAGGAPVSIAPAGIPFGATWTEDGTIFFGQLDPPGIFRVQASGGEMQQVVEAEEGELVYGPQLLPGGEWLLFTVRPAGAATWNQSVIVAQNLSTGERRELVPAARDGRYIPSGHIVYFLNGSILVVEFDAERLQVRGETASIFEGVTGSNNTSAAAHFATSDGGTLVYAPGAPGSVGRDLVWVDDRGTAELVGAPAGDYWWVDLSPDGDMVAVTRVDEGTRDVYTWDIGNAVLARLTSGGMDFNARFSPDGSMVAFASGRDVGDAGRNVYVAPRDGSATATLLHATNDHLYPMSWTQDGRLLLVSRTGGTAGSDDSDDLLVLSADGESLEELVAEPGFSEEAAVLSPDEQWLAYVSNDSGEQVWVRRFPGPSGRTAVSPSGAHSPRWSADGKTIFYVYDGALWAASMQLDTTASVVDRERLFSIGGYRMDHFGMPTYAVHPDGRFLFVTNPVAAGGSAVPHLKVVFNWFEELKERVPTGGSR